jgi:hypothetical protein
MIKQSLALALFLVGSAILPATSYAGVGLSVNIGGPRVVVQVPPPPPQAEVIPPPPPPPPCPGYEWTPGFWSWNGVDYVWTSGSYVLQQPGQHWVPAHYDQNGPSYIFVPGHWE